MNILRITIVISLSLMFAGCAVTPKNPILAKNVESIILGETSAAEIKTLFGDPAKERVRTSYDREYTINYYSNRKSIEGRCVIKSLHVELCSNKVNAFSFRSAYPESSTQFDEALRKKIIKKKTTRKGIASLFGKPTTRINLPSTMPRGFFGSEADEKSRGAKDAWGYRYAEFIHDDYRITRVTKNTLLFTLMVREWYQIFFTGKIPGILRGRPVRKPGNPFYL